MAGLREALSKLSSSGDGYRIEAPEGWTQGRTLYGGITAALTAQAAVLRFPDLPPLRSAQFAFIGPAAGQLRFVPQLLRQGRSATIVGVDCFAEDAVIARAIFTHGATRESEVTHDLAPMPEVPPASACEPLHAADRAAAGFFHNFEMRFAAGARPFTAGAAPWFLGWVRHIDDDGVDPVIALLALADAMPPAAMIAFPQAAPISTMTWSVDFTHPVRNGDWFLLRSASEQSGEGYSLQAMDAWSSDGQRVATGRQAVALFI